jgi:hypothetical protein
MPKEKVLSLPQERSISQKPVLTQKQRRFFAIFTGIFFMAGMLIYGPLALSGGLQPAFLFFLLGGVFFGGIASGGIFYGRFMARKNSVTLIVLSAVFFPVTLFVCVAAGIFSFIPYFIYNIVLYTHIKKYNDLSRLEQITRRAKTAAWVSIGCVLLTAYIGYMLYSSVQAVNASREIYEKTGYITGTPEYLVYKKYYYDKGIKDAAQKDYAFAIQDKSLFVLAKTKNTIYSDIFYPDTYGHYIDDDNSTRSMFTSGAYDFMRKDLNSIFTSISIRQYGGVYAFMLVIDARTNAQQTAEYFDSIDAMPISEATKKEIKSKEKVDLVIGTNDHTYADTQFLEINDTMGNPLKHLQSSDGKYTVFYATMLSTDKKYSITARYMGKAVTLTNEDIRNMNISKK